MQISNLLTHKMKLLDTVCRKLENEVQHLRLVLYKLLAWIFPGSILALTPEMDPAFSLFGFLIPVWFPFSGFHS